MNTVTNLTPRLQLTGVHVKPALLDRYRDALSALATAQRACDDANIEAERAFAAIQDALPSGVQLRVDSRDRAKLILATSANFDLSGRAVKLPTGMVDDFDAIPF